MRQPAAMLVVALSGALAAACAAPGAVTSGSASPGSPVAGPRHVAVAAASDLRFALAPTLVEKGRHARVPIDTYPRLEQGVVVAEAAADPAAARAFVEFVLGPDGRAVFDRYGFLEPGQ